MHVSRSSKGLLTYHNNESTEVQTLGAEERGRVNVARARGFEKTHALMNGEYTEKWQVAES